MPPAVLRTIAPRPRPNRAMDGEIERRRRRTSGRHRVREGESVVAAAGSPAPMKKAMNGAGTVRGERWAPKTIGLRPEHRQAARRRRHRRADHPRRVLAGDDEHPEDADRELRDLDAGESQLERVVDVARRGADGAVVRDVGGGEDREADDEDDGDEQRPDGRPDRPKLRPLGARQPRQGDPAGMRQARDRRWPRRHADTREILGSAPRYSSSSLGDIHERLLERHLLRRQLVQRVAASPLRGRRSPRRRGRAPRARRDRSDVTETEPWENSETSSVGVRGADAHDVLRSGGEGSRRPMRRRSAGRGRSRSDGRRSSPSRSSGETRRRRCGLRPRGPSAGRASSGCPRGRAR